VGKNFRVATATKDTNVEGEKKSQQQVVLLATPEMNSSLMRHDLTYIDAHHLSLSLKPDNQRIRSSSDFRKPRNGFQVVVDHRDAKPGKGCQWGNTRDKFGPDWQQHARAESS